MCSRWSKHFFIGYQEGEKMFSIFSHNWKGEEEKVNTYCNTWSSVQKENNVEFEKLLVEDPHMCWLS